jgi:hypothetical protein
MSWQRKNFLLSQLISIKKVGRQIIWLPRFILSSK